MICAGTRAACSRTSSFLLHSLIINCLSFLIAVHFGISDLLTKTAPSPLITGRGENPLLAVRVREKKNEFTARRTNAMNCLTHSKSSPQLLLDTENQRLLSPPEAGTLSSSKTSLSAFLGHHNTSPSPCHISFWHPTKQNQKCDAEHNGREDARHPYSTVQDCKHQVGANPLLHSTRRDQGHGS